VVPALVKIVTEDPATSSQTAAVLANLGEVAVPDLIRALKDDRTPKRDCRSGPDGAKGEDAAAALAEALVGPKRTNASYIAEALGRIGPAGAKASVARWCAQFQGRRSGCRPQGHLSVGAGGHRPPAAEAVPALLEALKDADPSVRHQAGLALKRIDAEVAAKAGVP